MQLDLTPELWRGLLGLTPLLLYLVLVFRGMIFSSLGNWGIPLWGSMVLWLAVLVSLKTPSQE